MGLFKPDKPEIENPGFFTSLLFFIMGTNNKGMYEKSNDPYAWCPGVGSKSKSNDSYAWCIGIKK